MSYPVAGIRQATTSTQGVVRLATNSEAESGSSSTIATTPSGLKTHVDNRVIDNLYAGSTVLSVTANSNNTWNHNLGLNKGAAIMIINGDYSANSGEIRGIDGYSSNAVTFYWDGGSSGNARINYVAVDF